MRVLLRTAAWRDHGLSPVLRPFYSNVLPNGPYDCIAHDAAGLQDLPVTLWHGSAPACPPDGQTASLFFFWTLRHFPICANVCRTAR